MSLLEMMVATAMMATLMTSVVVVVRSGHTVWTAHQNDLDVLEDAYAVLRHFVRQMRQAETVNQVSLPGDPSGELAFLAHDGTERSWSHANGQVLYDNGTASQPLARGIDALSFVGYEADGATQTTVVEEIQAVECRVQVTLPRGGGQPTTVTTRAWIRTW